MTMERLCCLMACSKAEPAPKGLAPGADQLLWGMWALDHHEQLPLRLRLRQLVIGTLLLLLMLSPSLVTFMV